MEEVYKSIPLNADLREIRTITISPGTGKKISCSLSRTTLPLQPGSQTTSVNYIALSYMWTYNPYFLPLWVWNKVALYDIWNYIWWLSVDCNGVRLPVMPNLYAALYAIRHPTENRVLWTDAICINQGDNDEKTGQLRLMGKIYALAEKTIVWLGPETFGYAPGFKAAHFLSTIICGNIRTASQQETPQQTSLNSRFKSFMSPCKYVWTLFAFINLLRNPYFTRIWIVQEIGLCPSLSFQCGSKSISLSDVAMATTAIPFSLLGSKNSLNFSNILAVRSLVRGRAREGLEDPSWMHAEAARGRLDLRQDVLSIISLFRASDATGKEDKVFALLGLCREMEQPDTYGVQEDCSLSVRDAYLMTAISIIRGKGNLDIFAALRMKANSGDLKGLPSWAPDWSDTEHIAVPISTRSGIHAATGGSLFDYGADNNPYVLMALPISAGYLKYDFSRSSLFPKYLNLSGQQFDRIAELGHACNTENAQASAWFCFKTIFSFAGSHRLQILVEWWTQFGGVQPDISQEFLATVTCGLDTEHSVPLMTSLLARFKGRDFHDLPLLLKFLWIFIPLRMFELYFRPTLERLHIITLQCFSIPTTLFLISYFGFAMCPRLVLFKFANTGERRFYEEGCKFMEGRRMAMTKKGRLALVPDETKEGDIIVVCKGARVPLILRDEGAEERWKIVGESYVSGFMNGELYDEKECKRLVVV